MLSTKPYRGSRDFFPEEMRFRKWMFNQLRKSVEQFGFEEIDAPILEPIEIYLAKTSEEIVSTQIYSFTDRGDRTVVIRPEMTPTVARMVAARSRELKKPIRWYSLPNLWRYERPSKGRLREHWQLNADIFGATDILWADVEILQLAINTLVSFGANAKHFRVKLNHREIVNFLFSEVIDIPKEKWPNVARILDKKAKISQEEYLKMMKDQSLEEVQIHAVNQYMEEPESFFATNREKNDAFQYLEKLIQIMKNTDYGNFIEYDPSVVRGFDYYTGFVFEIFDLDPENNRSLFGGGRYDKLTEAFGKESINAVGFGMGDVTLKDFLESHHLVPPIPKKTNFYLSVFSEESLHISAIQLAKTLRKEGFSVEMNLGQRKMGKQFQEADEKGIPYVIILGEEEIKNNTIQIKNLETGNQNTIKLNAYGGLKNTEWENIYAAENQSK